MIKIYSSSQKGAALFAVLMIVIVVTMLGLAAMRMSITSLALATNSQASNLVFQAADLGIRMISTNINEASVTSAMKSGGILGTMGEKALCLSTKSDVTWRNATEYAVKGFRDGPCDVANAENFVSGRNLVVTQVNYVRKRPSGSDSNASVSNLAFEEGSSDMPIEADIVIVTSTSVMPTLGSASVAKINACLNGTDSYMTAGMLSEEVLSSHESGKTALDIADANEAIKPTITDCLTDSGAVFTSHQDVFTLRRIN